MRRSFILFALFALTLTLARAGEGLKSGPQRGTTLPAPFDAIVVNSKVDGKVEKDRPHCLVCANGLNPAVLIFAREQSKTKALEELISQLDDTLGKHEKTGLNGYVVFLSPDARNSLGGETETDSEKLLDEATKRNALLARLYKRAEPLKQVVVAAFANEGPKGYNIDPKADVTIVLIQRLKVLANWSFEDGALTTENIEAILKKVDETVGKAPKKKAA